MQTYFPIKAFNISVVTLEQLSCKEWTHDEFPSMFHIPVFRISTSSEMFSNSIAVQPAMSGYHPAGIEKLVMLRNDLLCFTDICKYMILSLPLSLFSLTVKLPFSILTQRFRSDECSVNRDLCWVPHRLWRQTLKPRAVRVETCGEGGLLKALFSFNRAQALSQHRTESASAGLTEAASYL